MNVMHEHRYELSLSVWIGKFLFWTSIIFLHSFPVYSQSKVLESLAFESTLLNREIHYSVYLPEGYHTSERSYPVLYLLHGYGNNENAWIQFGNMQMLMDNGIQKGLVAPMIVIMPDAGNSWYADDLRGKFPYETMFVEEFIRFVDQKYRTRESKKFRAIGGLSMGAYGAVILTFHNPDLFSAAFALSPAIWTDEEIQKLSDNDYQRTFNSIYTTDPDKRLTDHWKHYSILNQASVVGTEELSKVKYLINSGDDDKGISTATAQLHILFRKRNIPHEYRVYNGGHTWQYWRNTFPEAIEFISEIFLEGVE